MKRYALLLSAALGMAAAQTPTVQTIPATPIPATGTSPALTPRPLVTADPGLTSANVSFNIRQTGNDMTVMLVALAKSAGYDIVLEPGVDAILQSGGAASTGAAGTAGATTTAPRVSYNFVNKPFNEVWPLVLDLYGLSYQTLRIGERPVLRVTAKPIQRIVRLPRTLSAALVERQLKLSFGSVKTVSSSQSSGNATQGANASTSETSREEIVLDSPTMRIVAEPASNSIIIRGTNQEVAQVERLLADIVAVQPPGLQAPVAVQDVQRIYTVRGAQADVVALLAAQYPGLRVTAAGQSGRVVITGPQTQVDVALALLGQVDLPAPSTPAASTGRSIYTVRGVQADVTALLAAQYPDLKVTPIGQTGRVVITGPQAQVDAALTLLGQVDTPAPVTPTTSAGRSVYTVKGQQADIATLLSAQYPDLKVTPVGQTGQLILTGPQGQIDAALTLLGQVDRAAPSPQATVQRVFQLVNASAEEVKATLEGTLARELTASGNAQSQVSVPVSTTDANGNPQVVTVPVGQTGAAQSAAQTGTGTAGGQASPTGASIIADKRTNTVIVRGTTAQVAQIAELIPQLDQVVPQINVQVRIQEITELAARTLGVDWKVNVGGFSVNFGGSGLGATFDPTRSLVGFNIFPTLQALETQGFTKRVYDGNITMQSGQRSLGSNTVTQNASSTAAASIKSGGRLEVNIPSGAANVASIQKQIDYGVNLDFFDPQVAPDGTVTLRVRGQVNQPASPIPTTGVPNILNFTNSEAQSTITFKSGQTVLMSGLLGTTETTSKSGVPFLSSLPVIGAAFSKQQTDRNQSQLLVIITGTVVK